MSVLVLASKSPRRAKILQSLGVEFEVFPTEAEEVCISHAPQRTVSVNALRKLEACRAANPDARILAADTVVWHGGRIYGKPRSEEEAATFLSELSGRVHNVFTGVAFCEPGGPAECAIAVSDVVFRPLSASLIRRYIERVKPLDRAGAYDIDESGDLIVERWTGEYENIMGLPVEPLRGFLGIGCAKGDS